ncbi:MAG: DUF1223 domain-containing protein [Pseudomonadota bacterium]
MAQGKVIEMRSWMVAALAAIWAFAGAAQADRLVVVELFTSQGCSSCPPADALLGELSARDDVLPLALHVDYWDYIGWKDEFADPAHTVRQKGYARAAGDRTIYTPQMIVGGTEHVIGYKPMKLATIIEKHGDQAAPVALTLTRTGDRLRIVANAEETLAGGYLFQLVSWRPKAEVSIGRGENAGRTLTYHNVVSRLAEIGQWNGQGRHAITVEIPDQGPHAILLQRSGPGPIVAAARVPE